MPQNRYWCWDKQLVAREATGRDCKGEQKKSYDTVRKGRSTNKTTPKGLFLQPAPRESLMGGLIS